MVVGAGMNCPYCGTELRNGVRYCTTCGVTIHGMSTNSAIRVKPRNHIAVVLTCMLAIAIVGGSCLGLHLRQALSCFISAHSEHAIVLNISAAGWDTDSGASRVPIHITGKTVDGITVDKPASPPAKPPVVLLTIRVILQWHQMPFYNRHSSRNHALSPYTSATAYFPATTFWCLPDIFTAHFETTNGTICNPRTTCKATPHE